MNPTRPQNALQEGPASEFNRSLLRGFWGAATCLALLLVVLTPHRTPEFVVAAGVIWAAALLPCYFWCSGRVGGIPIFPVYAVTFVWTYGFPLLGSSSEIRRYGIPAVSYASLTVAGFIVLGTAVWYAVLKRPPAPTGSDLVLVGRRADVLFFAALALNVLFNVVLMGGQLDLEGGTMGFVRGIILGLNTLAVFVLAYRWGSGDLSRGKIYAFVGLFGLYLVSNAASLLLVGALAAALLATIAFVVGRGRVPWTPIVIGIVIAAFLHTGKAEMRKKYWDPESQTPLQLADYPGLYVEWIGYSFDNLTLEDNEDIVDPSTPEQQSILDRSSLLQILLMAQDLSPDQVPYMAGETYRIVPELLIPRMFYPDKPSTHEGTTLLNIHYKRQTREDTLRTTIGWGLLNESFANFGLVGVGLLALVLGGAYAWAARWAQGTGLLSLRSFFCVLLVANAFQTEFSAGVFISSLFQAAVTLLFFALVFMRRAPKSAAETARRLPNPLTPRRPGLVPRAADTRPPLEIPGQ